MSDNRIPAEWTVAAIAAVRLVSATVADAMAKVAETVETVYGFPPSGAGVNENGDAVKPAWSATVVRDGIKVPLIGVNPTAATNPASVLVALIHGLILESCPVKETKDDAGKVTRVTRYGEQFNAACKGILDSPREPRKDGTAGKFAGTRAFIPFVAVEAAIKEALPALPPLPFAYVPDRIVRTSLTIRLIGPSGVKYGANVKLLDSAKPDTITGALSARASFEKDGMKPDPENPATLEWYASVDEYLKTLAA